MIKKIAISVFAVFVFAAGCVGFIKLNYWERSKSIIYSASGFRSYEGLKGRNAYLIDRNHNENDSISRQKFRQEFQHNELLPADSLRRTEPFEGRRGHGEFRGGGGFGQGRHREGGGFRNSKSVSLGNVGWFLAVFAAATLITVYIDMIIKYLIKRKKVSVN